MFVLKKFHTIHNFSHNVRIAKNIESSRNETGPQMGASFIDRCRAGSYYLQLLCQMRFRSNLIRVDLFKLFYLKLICDKNKMNIKEVYSLL